MSDPCHAYPSDLSDAEWTILAPLLPPGELEMTPGHRAASAFARPAYVD
jgi:transposase